MAGAAAVAGATPPATRLQRLVSDASRSNRLPRWLRRAIPHDAGPGASIAVFAAFVAAVIVAVVVIASVASALTSGGGPTLQAGSGNAGTGATGQSLAGGGSAGHCVSDDSGLGLEGTAVPDSAASVASSLRQQVAACRGGPLSDVSATCGDQTSYDAQAANGQDEGKVYVYQCTVNATGAIVAQFSSLPWDLEVTVQANNGSWEQG
jgi:hypothetical protein